MLFFFLRDRDEKVQIFSKNDLIMSDAIQLRGQLDSKSVSSIELSTRRSIKRTAQSTRRRLLLSGIDATAPAAHDLHTGATKVALRQLYKIIPDTPDRASVRKSPPSDLVSESTFLIGTAYGDEAVVLTDNSFFETTNFKSSLEPQTPHDVVHAVLRKFKCASEARLQAKKAADDRIHATYAVDAPQTTQQNELDERESSNGTTIKNTMNMVWARLTGFVAKIGQWHHESTNESKELVTFISIPTASLDIDVDDSSTPDTGCSGNMAFTEAEMTKARLQVAQLEAYGRHTARSACRG